MRPLLLLAAALAACSATRPRLGDLDAAFREDAERVRLRAPTLRDLDPARAANAPRVFARTEALAGEYLAATDGDSTRRNYVRALLACARLAQGRRDEARQVLGAIKRRRGDDLSDENVVITAALHAVGASRTVAAREAVDDMLRRRIETAEFVRRYGSFVGLGLPDPGSRDYELTVKQHALELESTCFVGPALPADEAAKHRNDLRRLVAEQFYNDAAALLVALEGGPRPGTDAVERWLASVAVGCFVVQGQIVGELLPAPLSEEQKQWQREQILPTYARARDLAERHLLPPGARADLDRAALPVAGERDPGRRLYARLREAEVAVVAWIDTR